MNHHLARGAAALSVACLIALAGPGAAAQAAETAQTDLAEQANAAYAAERWDDAARLYRMRVEARPDSARDWIRLGVAARQTGELADALVALERARELGAPAAMVDVEVARTQAMAEEPSAAMDALGAAVGAGFANPAMLRSAPEFEALRADPRFDEFVARAQDNRTPCARRPAFRQFDFWLGEWEVHDAQGTLQGTNSITLREGGCYLFEQWTGAGGSSGSSINYYDAARQKWVQHWVSQGGSQIQIEGGLEDDGSMVLVGRIYYLTTGQSADFRGRWTPLDDGRVRQFFEQSTDGGTTWASWFEGFYTRSTAPDS